MVIVARSGRELEREVFGQAPPLVSRSCRSFREAVQFVRHHRLPLGHFPILPKEPVACSLYWHTITQFKKREQRNVLLWLAVNTPLDWHGVDAFFWYCGRIVTVDLSWNKKLHRPSLADFLITKEDIECRQVKLISRAIAAVLQSKACPLNSHEI